ncbi:MAG: DUF3078 domain-containing protein [Bacteroidota bacterium]
MQLLRISFAFLFFLLPDLLVAQIQDSVAVDKKMEERKVRYSILGSLSASYITYKNWDGEDHTSLTFLTNAEFRHRLSKGSGWSHEHLVKAELGYLNYTDSLWIKSNDQFKCALQWNEKPGKYITHSYSVFLQSQFLKSYRYDYSDEGRLLKEKKGWFFAPGILEIAYGLNWKFWDQCRINTAFATCRIRTLPKDDDEERQEVFITTTKKVITTEYGFSTQVYIYKEFYDKHILWDHQGRIFFNAISKNNISADISNRFTIRFLKYMQFRIDTHFIYDPAFSTKPAFRQELLLGVFYELRK